MRRKHEDSISIGWRGLEILPALEINGLLW
jgi:hypothetical protein